MLKAVLVISTSRLCAPHKAAVIDVGGQRGGRRGRLKGCAGDLKVMSLLMLQAVRCVMLCAVFTLTLTLTLTLTPGASCSARC